MRSPRSALLLFVLLSIGGCDFLRGYAEGHPEDLVPYEQADLTTAQLGAARFLFDDFGTLNTDALAEQTLPWKLAAALTLLARHPDEPATVAHFRESLSAFGFIYPARVENWPIDRQPRFRAPLGIVTGFVRRNLPSFRLQAANIGCASCHAGVTYDAQGMPLDAVWLGLPNTSLDLDGWLEAIGTATRAHISEEDRVLSIVKQLFPETSAEELETLRKSSWPSLVARAMARGALVKITHGGPGRANLLDAVNHEFHLARAGNAAVSIPSLADETLRWSALVDGALTRSNEPRFQARRAEEAAPPGRGAEMVIAVDGAAVGIDAARSGEILESLRQSLNFIAGYTPPKFPGRIDEPAAARGAVLYARCAECHGEYVERDDRLVLRSFPNKLVSLADIGTDGVRAGAVTEPWMAALEASTMGPSIEVSRTKGYVAPSLAGIWATAPYLHNGSVPTLAALMTPSERPAKFEVGGHALDFRKVGIAGELDAQGVYVYPPGYQPWSIPRVYDTSRPGQSNRGHEKEFDGLSPADKADLLEFLKQL